MTIYRPKTIFSPFSKIFENIYQRLYNFLTKQNILCDDQFGFRERHSITSTITDVYTFVLQNRDQQKFTCAIFLDLKKAFHSVDHQILLTKLYKRLLEEWLLIYLKTI